MTLAKRCLGPAQRQLVEAFEELGFGRIGDGSPCLGRATQTVREIKLGSEPGPCERSNDSLALKACIRSELNQLGDGLVAIEVRHGVPFRILVRYRREELQL